MPADHQDRLLGAMLAYEMQGKSTVSFKQLSKDLDFMERTKTWRSAWRDLIETKYFIEPEVGGAAVNFTGTEYRMTQAGKDHASTPEYVEFMKEQNFVPQTNNEHQEKIKKRLLNEKAVLIFDKLLAHGSLTRKELATLLGCNDRSHNFFYGFKDLKTKGLIEDDASSGKGKKQRLSDKAFLNPEDRPETVEVDATEFLKGNMAIEGRKKGNTSKKAGKKKSKRDKKDTEAEDADDDGSDKSEIKAENTNKKVKEEEEGAEEKDDDGVDVPDAVKSVSNAAETHKKVKKETTATEEEEEDDDDVETPDTVKSESKEEKNVNEEKNDVEEKDEVEDEDDNVPDTVKTGGSAGKKPPKRKASGEIVWVMDGKTPWQAQLAEPKEKKHSHSEADHKEEKVEIQWCHNGKFQMVLWSNVQLEEDADADKDTDKDDSDKKVKTTKETRKSKRSKGAKNYCEDAAVEEADDYDDPKEDEDDDSHNSKSKAKRRARKRIKL